MWILHNRGQQPHVLLQDSQVDLVFYTVEFEDNSNGRNWKEKFQHAIQALKGRKLDSIICKLA